MLQKFKEHINSNFSFLKDKKLLIAISGGIDSIVLSHLLHLSNFDISFAHCNFKLRGNESDEDEVFIKELGKTLNKKIFTTHFDTENYAKENKKSIQIAARDLRYNWFKELIKEYQYDYIITGHNTNDNLETFLINLSRGTGLEGLTGIPPINGKIVRPLLAFSRDEIVLFAIKNNITWREDKSNASIKYVRNKVRHQVLPILREINPNLLSSFQNTLTYLNESQQIIDEKVAEISSKIIKKDANGILKIDILEFDKTPHKKAYLYQILKDYGFTEWNDVVDLITAQSGKQLFSKEYRLIKDRDFIILTKLNTALEAKNQFKIPESTRKIEKPIALSLNIVSEEMDIDNKTIYVDKDLLKFPLTARKWEYGDYFCPTGMNGTKKISRYFKDKKLSLLDKENIWLLANADNEIIWVISYRQDNRFLATNTTKNILKITTL